jgi:hypothetical protein
MNWYKKAIVTEEPITYESYGHSNYETMETDPDYPNYMWYYYGDLLVQEETANKPTHGEAWPSLAGIDSKLYKGRYDSSQNIITILKPLDKQFNETHPFLITLLKNKFGKDAEIREF